MFSSASCFPVKSVRRGMTLSNLVNQVNPVKNSFPMNAYESLQQRSREIAGYNSAASLLSWDQETYMPPKAGAYRAEQLGQMAGLAHRLGTSADIGDWLKS